MSGVWMFKNGVSRLEDNPGENIENTKRKVLVHTPNNEVITSYSLLEQHLCALGWERYSVDPDIFHFQKAPTDLISLPIDFSTFKPVHMYDIVLKNPGMFQVRDM